MYFLLKNKSGAEQQKAYVDTCVDHINDLSNNEIKKLSLPPEVKKGPAKISTGFKPNA